MVMLNPCVAVCIGTELSVTCTVKPVVPFAFGVPVIAPVAAFRDAQEGRLPKEIENVYGVFPPVAFTWQA
jgi:hypothetical protein